MEAAVRVELDTADFIGDSTLTPLARVRAARRAKEEADRAYEQAIADAIGIGHSLRHVAQAAGLSHTGVAKISQRVANHVTFQ